jgi:hypothetical protein
MNNITTYIKEAFITKSNIKNVRKSQNSVDISDIDFIKPTDEDCFKFQKLLHELGVMPTGRGKIDGYDYTGWCISTLKNIGDDAIALVMKYKDNVVNGTFFTPVVKFYLNNDKKEIIMFITTDNGPRSTTVFPELYKLCEGIAEALGFYEWDDEYNGWIKNKK